LMIDSDFCKEKQKKKNISIFFASLLRQKTIDLHGN